MAQEFPPLLLRKINEEVNDFKNKHIHLVPGLMFNQHDTIEQIYFYYNSKFQSGEVDEEGDKKYFFNINRNPCKVFSKAIDFDTKNIRLLTAGGGDPLKTWFMERDLKFWMRDKKFGKVLNRLFAEIPVFGSAVIKIVNGTPYFVDLRNFVVEQQADDLDSAGYITEIHNFTVEKFRKVGKEMGWKQSSIDEAIEKFREMKGVTHIRVYERYGDVMEEKNGKNEWNRKRVFIADVGVDEFNQRGDMTIQHAGVLLRMDDWEGHPYWEFHAEKLPGRWLGIGVVETLFEPQIRLNELSNLQAKGSYYSALRIFQTRDSGVARNFLTDVRNGDVLKTESEITPVNMDDRNLAHFNEETQKWMGNRDEVTFAYDVVQGERLPAGTPLGSAQLAATQTLSYFEQIQENIALDVKEMLYEAIIPAFLKESTSEHTLRLVGQDLDAFVALIKNEMVFKEMLRQVVGTLAGGPFPTEHDRDAIGVAVESSIKQGKEKLLPVPKDFYKNVKYDVDIDITGESVDTRVRYATKFAILQAITADPTMTQDPMKRAFLFSMAEDGGVNLTDFLGSEQKSMEDMVPPGRAGGGVSAPAETLQGSMTQTL